MDAKEIAGMLRQVADWLEKGFFSATDWKITYPEIGHGSEVLELALRAVARSKRD